MAVARLNVDVLAIICHFLTDVSHILSFALTCSALHPVAIRRLISMRPIYLGDSTSIRQFHSFVFADKPTRARHIRALEIGTRPRPRKSPEAPPAKDEPLLIDILNSCPHLERISVVLRPRGTDRPYISDVIAGIQSLRALSVNGKLKDPVVFLQGVRAPLRMLSIHCSDPSGAQWSPASLEKILPRFAPTLEELELTTFFSYPYETEGNISTPSRSVFLLPQYLAVRSFSVAQYQGMPSLEHLQHLFPALDGTLTFYLFGVWAKEGNFTAVRAANQRAQDNGTEPSPRAWTKLARVACSAHMFYVLGLRCPIGLVMLDRISRYTKRYLVAALREQPVRRLELSLELSRGLKVFDKLFPPELGDTLTHLTLFCQDERYGGSDNAIQGAAAARGHWDDILDNMRPALQPLHGLTHLRVVFHSIKHQGPYLFLDVAGKDEYLRALGGPPFERSEETAGSLVRALPSWQYVFLTATGNLKLPMSMFSVHERWHAAHAWRVAEPPTDGTKDKDGWPVLVELHEEVAETIIRKEELVLSKADEAALDKHGDSA
ncbi:hypothetical protein V8D89_002850 [Ganoderma adspersum]